ncbi:protein NPC2 homolog [Cimex lectularius]|uniref:MD-2-related lipid-recognition domain-containing protein n=1 Tax=Cimex lectularius TaxID=79782 RepID=A0A8I6S398_CIMLE|nr:protein NPC2 homolog [Cimex lectularius]
MNVIRFTALALLAFANLALGEVEDCGSEEGSLDAVEISDCNLDTMKACPLKRGGEVVMKMKFTTKKPETNITTVVHGILGLIKVKFNLPDGDNACLTSGLECPLEENKQYTYSASLPVLNKYPRLSVKVQWELKDSANKNIVCVKIPAKIV